MRSDDEAAGFYTCFISYSHTDKAFARLLHSQLQARNIRCWLDEHDLTPGDRILDEVNEAVRLHDRILLCCSAASLTSWWVKDEIRKAIERERRDGRDIIIPLMVDRYLLDGWEDGLASDLRSRLAADFTGWEHDNSKFDEQFERVMRALRTKEGSPKKEILEGIGGIGNELRPQNASLGGASDSSSIVVPVASLELRTWRIPEFPEQPYPVLQPYTHPALLGGRDNDLARLRQDLLRPVPIFGLYASSGVGKSSLLRGGLLPTLRQEGTPAAMVRHPQEPGLAAHLMGDLVQGRGATIHDEDWRNFVERLRKVADLSSKIPVLIIDQFEELFRRDDAEAARATVGILLAATVHNKPLAPCRWLIGYREEYHGEVVAWLRDVLTEARAQRRDGIKELPYDLGTSDRFQPRPLAPLGAPVPGTDSLSEAHECFLSAITKPLSLLGSDGMPIYPWRFAGDSATRLALAFAKARVERPDDPLTPELQVVLAHLLKKAKPEEIIEFRQDPDTLIGKALGGHLEEALGAAFPAGQARVEQRRARALLALRELAYVAKQPNKSLSVSELAAAIGDDGEKILEQLATPLTRLVVARSGPDGSVRYSLSHERMAEAVVRMVDTEAQHGGLLVDTELLRLRRFVTLETALFHSAKTAAPRVTRHYFKKIAANEDALLWDDERRSWWMACQTRRRASRRRAGTWALASTTALVLVTLGIFYWVEMLASRRTLLDQVAQGDPATTFQLLNRLESENLNSNELLAQLRKRDVPSVALERGLGGLEGVERNVAVLATVELLLPLVDEKHEDPVLIANLVWALDYAPARDPKYADRARELRRRVLAPLRRDRPQPAMPGPGDDKWIEIPAGSFFMGNKGDVGGQADEKPLHKVTLSAFRIQRYEVTNGEYRRFKPNHEGADNLPARFVNWYEATTYAAWLGGRLPTEAEWEYAARAGCAFAYCNAEGRAVTADSVAWKLHNARTDAFFAPQPVGLLDSNPWGLFDTLGNLWEWTSDWHGPYSAEGQYNPGGPPNGSARVSRGGSFRNVRVWVSGRGWYPPGDRAEYQGLRVVLPSDQH